MRESLRFAGSGVVLGLAVVAAAALGSCGPGVSSAVRGSAPLDPTEPFLVQVLDEPPARAAETVSLSAVVMKPGKPLPEAPDPGEVEAMRRVAADRGANALLIERLDTHWRRAFYGVGLRYLPDGKAAPELGTCTQPEAAEGLARAERRALRCLAELRKERPALTGRAALVFEVDALGGVRREAAPPEASRDTLVQGCVLEAVLREDFGAPRGFGCRLAIGLDLQGGEEGRP